ncbi:hypothetical protein B2J93_6226 [Marssonina coronariae]|uniref:Uncharacterized protein n=1 Tax=Diplocarpon coronariae TaxID=2795749 RepID=A0A218ZDU4_9HELO|nr:hypothetical protein B2J93_6226 [Marssonina coronariae]
MAPDKAPRSTNDDNHSRGVRPFASGFSRAPNVFTPVCCLTGKGKEEVEAPNELDASRITQDSRVTAKRTSYDKNEPVTYPQRDRIRPLNVYTPIRGLCGKERESVQALNRVNMARARAMSVNIKLPTTRVGDGQTPFLPRATGGGKRSSRTTSWARSMNGRATFSSGKESALFTRPVDASRVLVGGERRMVPAAPLSRGTCGTQSRTVLWSQPLESDSSECRAADDFLTLKLDRQTGISDAAESVTRSFHDPEDEESPLLFLSQESKPLEDCFWGQAGGNPTSVNSQPKRLNSVIEGPEQEEEESGDQVDEEEARQEDAESEQEGPLSEIDIELIALGGDDITILTPPISSPKRHRIPTSYRPGDADDENDESSGHQVLAKKQRTSRRVPSVEARKASIQELPGRRAPMATRKESGAPSRVAKKGDRPRNRGNDKQRRRLPVDELVMIDERPYDSDVEMASRPPLELSQDPISQISEGHTDLEIDTRGQSITLKVKLSARRGFGIIDISKYRMPEPVPVNKQNQSLRTRFYADGFDGKEGEPIGRLMPIKQSVRRTQSHVKMSIQLGELTLVSEKPADKTPGKQTRRQKRTKVAEVQTAPKIIEPEDDQMLLDAREVLEEVEDSCRLRFPAKLAKNLRRPVVDRSLLSTSTSAGHTSPLKHKAQKNCPMSTRIIKTQIRPKEAPQGPAMELQDASQVPGQPISMPAPPVTRSSVRIREDLIALQEIGLVTMKRSGYSNSGELEGQGPYTDLKPAANPGELEEECGDSPGDEVCMTNAEDDNERVDLDNRYDINLPPDPEPLQTTLTDNDEAATYLARGDRDVATEEQGYGPKEDSMREPTGTQLPGGAVCPKQASKDVENSTKMMLLELHQGIESVKIKKRGGRKGSRSTASTVTSRYTSTVARRSQQTQGSFGATPSITRRVPEARVDHRADQRPQKLLYSDDTDSSWRPRILDTSGPDAQVDEEIIDFPTPLPLKQKAALERRQSLRARLISVRKPLNTAKVRPERQTQEVIPVDAYGSHWGSIELGGAREFSARSFASTIPETQFLDIPEEHRTQVMEKDMSYFSQASQQLDLRSHRSISSRLLSTPARVRFAQQEESRGDDMMTGGIPISATFQHTITSPFKTPLSQRLGSSQRTPSKGRSLKELTRQASLGMGTVLLGTSARKGSRNVCITSLHQQFNVRS